MPQGMLVLLEAALHNHLPSRLVHLESRNPRLENRESGIVRLPSRLEHAIHRCGNLSRSHEIVSLNVAAIALILDTKVTLAKISPTNFRAKVSDVGHGTITYNDAGTAVARPGRAQLPVGQ